MEIFQTIWTALTTPNETLSNLISLPFFFVETLVNMLLFTTLFNIESNKKLKIIYVIFSAMTSWLTRIFIPDPYGTFINIFIMFLLIKFIFKVSVLKSILSIFIPLCINIILELFLLKFYQKILHIPYDYVMTIPIYRLLLASSIYICSFIIYRFTKYFKFNVNLDFMNPKSRRLFIFSSAFGIITLGLQVYLISFYSDTMPVIITFISILSLLAYFFLSIYSLLNTRKLEITAMELEKEQLFNKTLSNLHDSVRGFKHDFNNIVQSIGGYVERGDLNGLKIYYYQLLGDCQRINNLASFSPSVMTNPPIYNLLTSKYYEAEEMGIHIDLGIFINVSEIEENMKIYEFTRILGILLDNAIEAANECKEKKVIVSFQKEPYKNRLVMKIENTYLNKDIDTERIFEKNYSTKSSKTNSGLGLWEVRQILKRNNNLNLFTTKNNEFFVQQFEIYY